MTISEDTANVVQFLDLFSEGTLRKKNDLFLLIESAALSNNHKLMNNIIFAGKSFYNLSRKIKRTSEHSDIVYKEILRNADELRKMIGSVLIDDNEITSRFKVTYFDDSSGCLANLIDLAYDLSIMKNAQSKRLEILKQAEDELL